MMRRAQLVALIIGLTLSASQARAEPAQPGYSAAGLYNLANSYARAEKPGMAVLNYERARLLAPNDPDIEANLRFVRESLHLPLESRNWLDRAVRVATPAAFAWIGVLGLMLTGVSLLAGRLKLGHRLIRVAAFSFGVVMLGLTVCNGVVLWPKLHEGVVIANAAAVRVSPVPMGDPLFTLPEAESVRIIADHEGFVLVKTRAGRVGWVAQANLAPVVPRDKR